MKIDYEEQKRMLEAGEVIINRMLDESMEKRYSIKRPKEGFDLPNWTALYNNHFPITRTVEDPMLADYLLRAAPVGVSHEIRFMLKLIARHEVAKL